MIDLEDSTMPAKPYRDVLAEARRLSLEEQASLVRELSQRPATATNGPPRSLYEALQSRGLIGCLPDAPADLSTNPRYMEGFGRHEE